MLALLHHSSSSSRQLPVVLQGRAWGPRRQMQLLLCWALGLGGQLGVPPPWLWMLQAAQQQQVLLAVGCSSCSPELLLAMPHLAALSW
jgi:hypothetical protein